MRIFQIDLKIMCFRCFFSSVFEKMQAVIHSTKVRIYAKNANRCDILTSNLALYNEKLRGKCQKKRISAEFCCIIKQKLD